MCVDFRKINTVTKVNQHPIPNIEDNLSQMSGSSFFSTIDLKSGFHQIRLTDEAQPKTAFITPIGQVQYTVLPLGLSGAPAEFQQRMEETFGPRLPDYISLFFDDIITHSATFDDHLRHLEAVFDRLNEEGLKLNPSKCFLFQRRTSYLGHVVSSFQKYLDC